MSSECHDVVIVLLQVLKGAWIYSSKGGFWDRYVICEFTLSDGIDRGHDLPAWLEDEPIHGQALPLS